MLVNIPKYPQMKKNWPVRYLKLENRLKFAEHGTHVLKQEVTKWLTSRMQ